jgi:hypothetical protein
VGEGPLGDGLAAEAGPLTSWAVAPSRQRQVTVVPAGRCACGGVGQVGEGHGGADGVGGWRGGGGGAALQRLGARSIRYGEVNGQPGALFLDLDGRPVLVLSLDIADDLVQTVHGVTNPDKLRHLSPPTDPD